MIIFRKNRKTRGGDFVVFKSEDFDEIGDYSKIYVRKAGKFGKEEELVLMTLTEFEELTGETYDEE